MLALLTDEHISHVVAEQVRLKRADIHIETLLRWRSGTLRNTADDVVLATAREEGLTLVTYDQKTIPPLLSELAGSGRHHSGVIFVDRNTLSSENIGGVTQALIAFYDQYQALDWTDLAMFLSPAK
jgi:hypothetical protein